MEADKEFPAGDLEGFLEGGELFVIHDDRLFHQGVGPLFPGVEGDTDLSVIVACDELHVVFLVFSPERGGIPFLIPLFPEYLRRVDLMDRLDVHKRFHVGDYVYFCVIAVTE